MGKYDPHAEMLGGYQPLDGTIEFYGRIRSILKPGDCVVDLGAGRGGWYHDDKSDTRRNMRDIRPAVGKLIGLDVDPVVLTNPATTENFVIEGDLPLETGSADVIIADYVLEHITDPKGFAAEINRVLKPGGYFCARTQTRFHYVALAARLVRNRRHSDVLGRVQPNRKAEDVFPTAYRMNTIRHVRGYFPGYQNYSYLYCGEPSYFFGSKCMFGFMEIAQRLLPRALVSNLFVFLR